MFAKVKEFQRRGRNVNQKINIYSLEHMNELNEKAQQRMKDMKKKSNLNNILVKTNESELDTHPHEKTGAV